MPSRGSSQPPTNAPMMPTTMSPSNPKPPPLTMTPANAPATAPTMSQITIVSTGMTVLPLSRSALDAGNLGSFDANAGHQTLLVEDEGIGIVLQRGGRQVLGDAFIDDDPGRSQADLPSLRTVDVVYRLLRHQENHVAVGLGDRRGTD